MLAAWLLTAAVPLIAAAAGQGLPHAAAPTRPQTAPQNPREELPVFRAETNLALVRFHVVRKGSYVDDLNPKDIVVLEDGKPRQFSLFEGGRLARRTIPADVALVFDISGSVTQAGLLDPLAFKSTILDGIAYAKLAVYAFDKNLLRFCRPTRDPAVLAGAFGRILNFRRGAQPEPDVIPLQLPPKRKADPRGGTWLFEAVMGAARDAAASPGNATRMLLVFSDGFPTTDTRPEEGAAVPRDLGVPVYPVLLGHQRYIEEARAVQESGYNREGVLSQGARDRLARIEDKERQMEEFGRLGELTGGRSFDPRFINAEILRQILGAMVAQVRCEYVVGVTLAPSARPTARKLEVKLRSKELGKVLGGVRIVKQ